MGGLLQQLNDTAFSHYLRDAPYPFPILIIIHIITIALFGGMVAIGNLRVLGLAMKTVPVSQVIGQFRFWKWAAFTILLITGVLIAASDPIEYGGNIMFWISNGILAVAGVNAAIFRYGVYENVSQWDMAEPAPRAARRWAGISLALWVTLIFAGRAVAFF